MFDDQLSSSYLIVSQNRQSYKIRTQDLASQMFQEYVDRLQLGSMAYEESSEYAKSSHDHDIYTSAFWQSSQLTRPKKLINIKDTTHSVEFSLCANQPENSSHIDIESILSSYAPKIGEIQFRSTNTYVDIHSPDFDGWVPTLGQMYDLSDFEDQAALSTVFNSGTSIKFSVPNLQNFMKFDCSLTTSSELVQHKTCLPMHSHEANESIDQHAFKINLDQSGGWGIRTPGQFQGTRRLSAATQPSGQAFGQACHHGRGSHWEQNMSAVVQLTPDAFTNSGMKTNVDGIDNPESYPSYMTLPAFVYIGKVKS